MPGAVPLGPTTSNESPKITSAVEGSPGHVAPTPAQAEQAYIATCMAVLAAGSADLCGLASPAAPARPPARPAVPPGPPAASYAVQFWRTIPLPVPRPTIPPGYAVTGKTAYLVTNGTTDPATYTDQTPLGDLTIQARGEYRVDWGDNAPPGWAGPYPEEGAPWPNGQITHTYDDVGTYTVTVEEDWTAVWHLAGATGTLAGLHTTGTIPDFRVEQLQAVITN